MNESIREGIAKAIHKGWGSAMRGQGFVYGHERNSTEKTHPHLQSWDKMPEENKHSTYWSADQVIIFLQTIGVI